MASVSIFRDINREQLKSRLEDATLQGMHYHFKHSYKPSIIGFLIALGGGAVIAVAVLSAAHVLPGVDSPVGYTLLAVGSVAIIAGLGIIFGDRLAAFKHKKKYINIVNEELQEILSDDDRQYKRDFLNALDIIDDWNAPLFDADEEEVELEKDKNLRGCLYYRQSPGQLEIVFLKNEKKELHVHFFHSLIPKAASDETEAKRFYEQVQRPRFFEKDRRQSEGTSSSKI